MWCKNGGRRMKAKELAEELLKHPDFDVELIYMTSFKRDGMLFPDIYKYKIKGIADIGHSDKVIILDAEVEE
jgi:hypothetical protein